MSRDDSSCVVIAIDDLMSGDVLLPDEVATVFGGDGGALQPCFAHYYSAGAKRWSTATRVRCLTKGGGQPSNHGGKARGE
jgi:hypothetical protein